MRELTPELDGKILGVNTRCLPSDIGAYVNVCVVLVGGAIGDYAAYMGAGSPDFVKRYGNKISFEEACCHFPGGQLEVDRYRL